MGDFIANAAIKQLILGLTFKENCPDIRNSKVEDIIKCLREYDINPIVVDPLANEREAMREYGITLTDLSEVHDADCIIVAVAHEEFKNMNLHELDKLYKVGNNYEKVLIDVKNIFNKSVFSKNEYRYWNL